MQDEEVIWFDAAGHFRKGDVGKTGGYVYNSFRTASAILVASFILFVPQAKAQAETDERVANALAEMLQSARGVIGGHQDLINAAEPVEKGLTSDKVLDETIAAFIAKGNQALDAYDDERIVRLLSAQTDAIREVIAENQSTINRQDVEFKGFVPAVFARLVNERFAEKVGDEARIKVTAPPALVRNRKARPDAWELAVIEDRLASGAWPGGDAYQEVTGVDGRDAFRVLMPEYYSDGCLSCHGGPAGDIDITGYPKEGGILGELGGAISITLFR